MAILTAAEASKMSAATTAARVNDVRTYGHIFLCDTVMPQIVEATQHEHHAVVMLFDINYTGHSVEVFRNYIESELTNLGYKDVKMCLGNFDNRQCWKLQFCWDKQPN